MEICLRINVCPWRRCSLRVFMCFPLMCHVQLSPALWCQHILQDLHCGLKALHHITDGFPTFVTVLHLKTTRSVSSSVSIIADNLVWRISDVLVSTGLFSLYPCVGWVFQSNAGPERHISTTSGQIDIKFGMDIYICLNIWEIPCYGAMFLYCLYVSLCHVRVTWYTILLHLSHWSTSGEL